MNFAGLCLALWYLFSYQSVNGDFEARENLRFDIKVAYDQTGVSVKIIECLENSSEVVKSSCNDHGLAEQPKWDE
jgi:regulation of enolase protein 1 (concanavalin A-like superfamily)